MDKNSNPKRDTQKSFFTRYKDILTIFIFSRIAIYAVSISAFKFIQREIEPDNGLWLGIIPSGNTFLRIWERWDAIHYVSIALRGYTEIRPGILNTAFFPLYPLLGNIVSVFTGSVPAALLIVSNAAFLLSLIFLYELVTMEYDKDIALRTVLYISIFPFSLFFAGMFTESLFLLNLVATFYYAKKGKWFTAMVWGILLTATRLVGVGAIAGLAWMYMKDRNWNFQRIDKNAFALAAMPLGFVAFLLYSSSAFGNAFSTFESSQKAWNRTYTVPWAPFIEHIDRIKNGTGFPIFIYNVVIGIAAIVMLIAAFWYFRKRWEYFITAASLVLIPICSNQLNAMPRYVTVVFPFFIIMAYWGKNNLVNISIIIISTLYMGMLTALYANWWYIG